MMPFLMAALTDLDALLEIFITFLAHSFEQYRVTKSRWIGIVDEQNAQVLRNGFAANISASNSARRQCQHFSTRAMCIMPQTGQG